MPEAEEFSITPLELPTDSTLTKELPRLKRYLKSESARLQEWHRKGAGGHEICAARSSLIDTLLATLFDWTLETFDPKKRERKLTMSLVAIGGYGRLIKPTERHRYHVAPQWHHPECYPYFQP